jgi:hypothetical protein
MATYSQKEKLKIKSANIKFFKKYFPLLEFNRKFRKINRFFYIQGSSR